jgi:hypothetical protein
MTPTSPESNCPDTPESPTLIAVTGRSGKGTARQTIRIDHELWERFGRVADHLGVDRSQLVRDYIEKLVDEHDPSAATEPAADET